MGYSNRILFWSYSKASTMCKREGAATVFPLYPIVVNIFMEAFEKEAMSNIMPTPQLCSRYDTIDRKIENIRVFYL